MSDVRTEWERLRDRVDVEARGMKDSQSTLDELSARYRSLARSDRGVIDELLAEWVLSDDENLRFDALALISEHKIASALPALRSLATRLEQASVPGAPYEWAKVNRTIGQLSA